MKQIINNLRQPITTAIGVLGAAVAFALWGLGKAQATDLLIVVPLAAALIFASGDGVKFPKINR